MFTKVKIESMNLPLSLKEKVTTNSCEMKNYKKLLSGNGVYCLCKQRGKKSRLRFLT